MAKRPEKGEVKTRLAADVGDEAALKVYEYLLQQTFQTCQDFKMDTTIFWSAQPNIHSVFNEELQVGNDLGEKMWNAISAVDFEKIIVIGTDCPDLTTHHIHEAFHLLDNCDVVFGPALDGGYYLIGMKSRESSIFQDIHWSTASVLKESIQKCSECGKSYALLPVLSDIDDIQGLKRSRIFKNIEL